jgi:tetratricopeptide (TPR) repeat protein
MSGTEAADQLIRRSRRARQEGRRDDAARDLAEALPLLRQAARKTELAEVLRDLGELERRLPDGDSARRHYEEAVALFRDLGDPLRLAHTVRHLGDVHHDAGRAALAEPCYVEALEIYRRHAPDRPLDHANALRSLAVLRDEGGDTEATAALWREAHELYSTVLVHAGAAESALRLALYSQSHGDLEASRSWLAKASAAADSSDDPRPRRRVQEVRARLES